MAGTKADIIIAGVKAKLARDVEGGAYKRRTIRKEIQNNLLSQSEIPALVNREDQIQLFQTSWASGAKWWKPNIASDLASYFQANHMDVWSEPGKVVPTNLVVDAANTDIHDDCVVVATETDVYAIGNTTVTNASFRDVYKWTPASNAFVRETGFHSQVAAADHPISAVYDSNDGYIYVLVQDGTSGREIVRFNPVTAVGNAAWITNASSLRYGSSIVLTRFGILYYAGGSVFLIDKAVPSATAIFAPSGLETLAIPTGTTLFRNEELMIATPEGVFLVQNVANNGQNQPWVWRIDRDEAGNWIGAPYAPLPIGTMALSVAYHLGSIIIATSPEPQTIIDQTEHAEVTLYQYTQGQPGALGSILGGRDEVDETPYGMLGTSGPLLYIGGHKRLWIYDAIRGGLHSAWEWGTANTLGPYRTMAWVRDSADDGSMIFLGPDRIARTKRSLEDDPDTVVAFGDDETHYVLTSNFFDGGLPMEEKEITKVAILRDKDDGGSEWTVQISADEGAFADALVDDGTSDYAEADLSGTTGRRFQYRLIYQTKDVARKALRALLVSMTTGDMVTEWDLLLDGSELVFDNKKQDEETFYNNMLTIANTKAITTLIDNMQEQSQQTSDADAGNKVKVIAVEIMKGKPGESLVRILAREAQ